MIMIKTIFDIACFSMLEISFDSKSYGVTNLDAVPIFFNPMSNV